MIRPANHFARPNVKRTNSSRDQNLRNTARFGGQRSKQQNISRSNLHHSSSIFRLNLKTRQQSVTYVHYLPQVHPSRKTPTAGQGTTERASVRRTINIEKHNSKPAPSSHGVRCSGDSSTDTRSLSRPVRRFRGRSGLASRQERIPPPEERTCPPPPPAGITPKHNIQPTQAVLALTKLAPLGLG